MPLDANTLITTIGGSTTNSFVTLAELTSYVDLRLNTETFNSISEPDDKVRALVMAFNRLKRENWQGSKANSTQSGSWPRIWVPKLDAFVGYSYSYSSWGVIEYYASDEIPQEIKDAQCELALAYLDGFDDGEEDQIDAFSADGVSVKFRESRPNGGLPVAVAQLIGGLVAGNQLVRA